MVELKAALFQKEQEAKKYKKTGEEKPQKGRLSKRKREDEIYGTSKKNKGIEERAKRDLVALPGDPTAEEIEKKLREKVQLYSNFVQKGDYSDELMVDFERKNWDGEVDKETEISDPKLSFLNNFVKTEVIEYSNRRDDEKIDSLEYEQARESRIKAVLELSKETSTKRSQVEELKRRKLADKQAKLQQIKKMKNEKNVNNNIHTNISTD